MCELISFLLFHVLFIHRDFSLACSEKRRDTLLHKFKIHQRNSLAMRLCKNHFIWPLVFLPYFWTLTAVPYRIMSMVPSNMVLVWKLTPMMAFAPSALAWPEASSMSSLLVSSVNLLKLRTSPPQQAWKHVPMSTHALREVAYKYHM